MILRDTLLSAHLDGLECRSSGVVAYHCDAGHVFLLTSEDFRWNEPRRVGAGYALLV